MRGVIPDCHPHTALTSRELFMLHIDLVVCTSPGWKSFFNFLLPRERLIQGGFRSVLRHWESGCYLGNVSCGSESECMLRLPSFCGNKLCPGTMNSACFSPAAEEQNWDRAHADHQAAVLALRGRGFTRFFTDSPQKATKSALWMGLLDLKNLNQLHCYSGCARSVWKHMESPAWGHFMSVCVALTPVTGAQNRLADAGDLPAPHTFYRPQLAELDTQIHTHAPPCVQRNTQSKLISAIIHLEKLCHNPGDGSAVTTWLGTGLSWSSQVPFISLQIM